MLLLTFTLIAYSCSDRFVFPEKPDQFIAFGHGGGFVGKEYRYTLFPDGRLFSRSDSTQFLSRVPTKTTTQIFSNIRKLASGMKVVNDPGNTYGFVQWQEKEKNARWVWNSSNRANLGSELQINHAILMKLASDAEQKKN